MNSIKNNFPVGRQQYLKIAIIILGFLGFLDASYLTILHYKNAIPPCTVSNGCEIVLTSSYSTILGIPIALPGAGFFLAVIALSLLLLTSPIKLFKNLLILTAVSGTIVSVILIYIQFAILKAYCQYCLASEAISFLILFTAILIWKDIKASGKKP